MIFAKIPYFKRFRSVFLRKNHLLFKVTFSNKFIIQNKIKSKKQPLKIKNLEGFKKVKVVNCKKLFYLKL